MIGATETAGDIRVKVQSPGLPECSVTLTAEKSENESGVSCKEVLKFVPTECGRNDEIPVRKVELLADALEFTPDRREITVRTLIFPANADMAGDIEYRVTNITGIVTNIADCVVNADSTVTVRRRATGSFISGRSVKTERTECIFCRCCRSGQQGLEPRSSTHTASLQAVCIPEPARIFAAA